ncbi:phage portal protein [Nitratireductor alexandrii]|uniref:phage portal protein n=1 Tax=Nitratireductor alexandrii TaxID=2448161 RepID=UPI000FDAB97F|nr:phage portal protein [Nitratireductor alexandrii]
MRWRDLLSWLPASGTEKKAVPLSDSSVFEIFGSSPTISGQNINPSTAIRVPAVYSAVTLITSAIGSLPAKLFREADGGKQTAKDHPAYRLVHDEANDWTSAGKLRSQLTADALLRGNGYAFANRVDGRVVEFIRLDPNATSIECEDSGEPVYVHRDKEGREVRYDYRDILHVEVPLGISPITAGRESIGLAVDIEQAAGRVFAGGARPTAIFKHEKAKGGESGAAEVKAIKQAYRTATASGQFTEPMFLDGGWTYDEAKYSPLDPAFFETMRKEQVVEIARLFRVPPHLLFELSRATWSNAEEMFQSFLTLTLRPWLDEWEAAYQRVLLSSEERAAGHYVEFVVDDLLTSNAATRAKTYQAYRQMGAMTANEVRSGLNLPPIDGGDTLANPNITPGAPPADNDNPANGEEAA